MYTFVYIGMEKMFILLVIKPLVVAIGIWLILIMIIESIISLFVKKCVRNYYTMNWK